MPTAAAYRTAVTELGTVAGSVATMGRILDDYDTNFGFSGSSIADTVRDAIRAGRNNATGVGRAIDPLVVELNRRAQLCDRFTQDMTDYHRDYSAWAERSASYQASIARGGSAYPPGLAPQRPLPPFEGAEVG